MLKLSKQHSPLNRRQTVAQAVTALLEQHLVYLDHWEAKARDWNDTEGVHQLRVALRRMRSALRLFRPALPVEIVRPWAAEMRALARMLGPARDLDVFIDEALGVVAGRLPLPGEAILRDVAEQQRAEAYVAVRQMLDSERYASFKRGLADWLLTEGWSRGPLTEKHRQRLAGKVNTFARKRLDKQWQRVLQQGAVTDENAPEQLHQLRIECKKLRYAAEFFTPLFAGMDDFIEHLKDLQDLLGVINDVAVTREVLDQLIGDSTDIDVLRYAAGLIGWRSCERQRLMAQFGVRWNSFRATRKTW